MENKKHRGGYSSHRKGGGRGGGNNNNGSNANGGSGNNAAAERSNDEQPERPERVERRERGGREDRHQASREDRSTASEENSSSPPQRSERGRGRGSRYDRGGRLDRGGGGGGQPRDDEPEPQQQSLPPPPSGASTRGGSGDPPRRERHSRGGHGGGSTHSPGTMQPPSGPAPDYNAIHTTPPLHSKTPPSILGHGTQQSLPPLPDSAIPPQQLQQQQGGGGNQKPFMQDPSHVFPSTPYTPAVDHFLNPALRAPIYGGGGPRQLERDMQSVVVAGAKFQHFINIKTYDSQPMETFLLGEGKKMQVYKCSNRFSEKPVILRRIVDINISPADCQAVHDRFRHFRHPTLVPLAGITQTQEFVLGSSDVVMEYRMIKEARSLKELFFFDPENLAPIPESKVWSICCQLVSLIKVFHEVEVPLRGIHWSKMLWIESTERVMFSGIGLVDIGSNTSQATFQDLARGDLMALGILLLQLITAAPTAQAEHLNMLLANPERRPCYSPELVKMIQRLIQPASFTTITQISAELGDRMANEVGQQAGLTDYFAQQCGKEVHNGRLMKLMIKLNFVIGSFQDSNDWGNDANERFALRLFHSYLFNQVDDRNQPRVDWFRVYSCLNKLDVGSEELVQLISADGNSTLLVISYADLKSTVELLFAELQAAQDAALGTPPTMVTSPNTNSASAIGATTMMGSLGGNNNVPR